MTRTDSLKKKEFIHWVNKYDVYKGEGTLQYVRVLEICDT